MPSLSLEGFRGTLTTEILRSLQLIYIALALGTVVFLVVFMVLALGTEAPEPTADDTGLIQILTLVVLVMAVSLIPLSGAVANRVLRGDAPPVTAAGALARIRTALILRAALLEAAALFGLIVYLLAGMRGVLQQAPIYWANLFPWLFFIGFVALTFPTRDRLEEIFRTRLQTR